MPRHRRCLVVRGSREETEAHARALVAGLADALWVRAPADARRALGGSYAAVVLDQHDGVDADTLGLCHGFVWGGGALILRRPPADALRGAPRLALWPHADDDVGARFERRLEARLSAQEPPAPLAAHPARVGTSEQAAAVDRLVAVLGGDEPARVVLLADRGRGKSAALGLALARLPPGARVAVTSLEPAAVAEVLRFAPGLAWTPPDEVADAEPLDVVVVDEAAQLPVPLLQRLARRHAGARVALATTARGYEGTGRGFLLRFLAWARAEPPGAELLELRAPVRWDDGDPLEALVHHVLALDAAPAPDDALTGFDPSAVTHAVLDRDVLAADERLLRETFGLLVHAHYRTSPGDLHRMLDAPNLHTHALLHRGHVVAASLVAREGGLTRAHTEALARGDDRIRGHALADTLVTHAGRADAGTLDLVRSVRVATHPALRRAGLGRLLVDAVHATYAPDAFGTLFGATAELVRFRQRLGYAVVRVGAARGGRSGEPSVVLLRPTSDRARALTDDLRRELARDLDAQLELLGGLDPDLVAALRADLPEPAPPDPAALAGWLDGPRPFESVVTALTAEVEARRHLLPSLGEAQRALIVGRVLERRSWEDVGRRAGLPAKQVPKALKQAIRALLA